MIDDLDFILPKSAVDESRGGSSLANNQQALVRTNGKYCNFIQAD